MHGVLGFWGLPGPKLIRLETDDMAMTGLYTTEEPIYWADGGGNDYGDAETSVLVKEIIDAAGGGFGDLEPADANSLMSDLIVNSAKKRNLEVNGSIAYTA